jgi:thioredoxin-related protein
MKDNHYTYGLLLKGDDVAKAYKVKVFPSYFVIGKSGEIIVALNGFDEKTFTTVRAAIEAALIGKTLMLPTKPPPVTTTPADGAGGTTTSDK